MLTIALAYTSANQHTAHRISGDVASHVTVEHYSVGRANEGPTLRELLAETDVPTVVLVSGEFLTNPNCMLHAGEIFGGKRAVLPVFVRSHTYDELQDEVVSAPTTLANQADVMHYVNHWQDRYIDLRSQAEELSVSGGEAFDRYLRKIRETSVQVEETLHQIKDSRQLTEEQLAANDYQQLFLFADRPRLWEDFRTFEEELTDLADIPGMDLLANAAAANPVTDNLAGVHDGNLGGGAQVPATEPEKPAEVGPSPALPPTDEDQSPEEQANVWIERAWTLHDRGESDDALTLLAAGRDALPDDLRLHYHYALLLATATEDTAATRREVETILDKNPDHPDTLYLAGELALAAGNFSAAREHWEQLSDVEPFYPELNYRLGILLADHFPGEYLDAAAYLRRATKNTQPTGDAFYRYALLLSGPLGRTKKAVKMLRRATEVAPNHAYAHYELAVLLHRRGDYDAARLEFQTACTLNPAFATEANRRAFMATPLVSATPPDTEDALAALKQNLAVLEAKLAAREPAPDPPSAPAPAPEKGRGKTVMISGASAGIGRATARRLAAAGFRLILIGRRRERLEELAAELADRHDCATHLLELDVRDRTAVTTKVNDLPPDWQMIDVLINNAGKAKGADPFHEANLDHFDEMIDVNLKGLLYLSRAVSPGMVARRSGFIVNVCSTAGKEVYPNGNVYCATKHAVDALTRAMRLDFVHHGLRVGQICPAMVEETEFAMVRFDGDAERANIYADFQPLRAGDVAEAIHFMVTQPPHVNVLDMVIQGTQQASSTVVDRSGRAEEE